MGTCIDCGEAAVTKIYNVAYGKEMPYCAEHAEQAHAWLQDNGREVDWGRKETDPCQKGTVGCCVDHDKDRDDTCETW